MKFWNRLVVGLVALALGLSLSLGDAMAASSKSKKKDTKKKEEKKKKETRRSEPSGPRTYLTGTNTSGKSGLIFSETAHVVEMNQLQGSVHLTATLPTGGSIIGIPFGGAYGIAKNFEISASGSPSFFDPGGFSTFNLTFGGKYKFDLKGSDATKVALGADVVISLDGLDAVFIPRGNISHTLASGVLLNGQMGIGISTGTYVEASAGAGIPFSSNFTGLVEIGANQLGNGGSVLAGGVRVGQESFKFQALIGIPLEGNGVILGGGIVLASN